MGSLLGEGVGMKLQMKILMVILAVTLLALPLASASFVTVNPANATANQIYFDEVAHYDLTIINTDQVDRVFVWSANPVEWLIDTPSSTIVPADSQVTVPISLRPRPSNFRGAGFYVVPLTVSNSVETINSQLSVRIKSTQDRDLNYKPSVALGASIDSTVNPQELVSVQLQIRNRNILDIDELQVSVNGEHFEGTDSFPLGGLEERTVEYRYDIDDALEPGSYELVVRLIYEDAVISEVKKFYDVGSFSQIDRESVVSSSLFKKTTITTLMNDGNVLRQVTTNISIPWYKAPFTSVDVEANAYDRQSRGVYNLNIASQETVTITVVNNYRSIPILIFIIVLIIIFYFQTRSPMVISKQTIVTGRDEEGISEMRVRIFIRNRSPKPYYNVRLIDRAPSIAHVVAKGGLGVIEPSKIITTEKRGTIIKWDFENLDPYEERIVTYTIKARLKIIGHLGLPPTRMKFENQKGKQRTTQSGKTLIGTR